MKAEKVFRLDKSHIRKAGKVFASAFWDDPQVKYMIPEASRKSKTLRPIFEFALKYGIIHGEAYAVSPNLEGIAIWLPSEKAKISLLGILRSGLIRVLRKVDRKVMTKLLRSTRHAVSLKDNSIPGRHYYLFLLATKPSCQRKGHASVLLRTMLKRLDKERLPCFLTTHNETNIPIYERHGFKLVTSSLVPDSNLKHLGMLRQIPA